MTRLEPGLHGPAPADKTVGVDRNRLVRGTTVLTEAGVSQRDVPLCFEELLDTALSPSWVNAKLAKIEKTAARVNGRWEPTVEETLSGDEIYSNGSPNLLLVGNDSLYLYALTRQPTCDGETWGCVPKQRRRSPATMPFFRWDAAVGGAGCAGRPTYAVWLGTKSVSLTSQDSEPCQKITGGSIAQAVHEGSQAAARTARWRLPGRDAGALLTLAQQM